MRLRLPKRQPGTPGGEAFLAQCGEALDRSIPGFRTALMLAGLLGALVDSKTDPLRVRFFMSLQASCQRIFALAFIGAPTLPILPTVQRPRTRRP
jgi:hypothetical protein